MAKNLNRSASRIYPWPPIFNILMNDLFLFIKTFTLGNYTDGDTMYCSDKNANIEINRLGNSSVIISKSFCQKLHGS